MEIKAKGIIGLLKQTNYLLFAITVGVWLNLFVNLKPSKVESQSRIVDVNIAKIANQNLYSSSLPVDFKREVQVDIQSIGGGKVSSVRGTLPVVVVK